MNRSTLRATIAVTLVVAAGDVASAGAASAFPSLTSDVSGNTGVGSGVLTTPFGTVDNTALGEFVLGLLQTGSENTGVGFGALQADVGGGQNVAVGYIALGAATIGGNNTAIGSSALNSLTTGGNNVAIGSSAGLGLQTGNDNIYIGANVGASSADQGKIVIGQLGIQSATYLAGVTSANLGSDSYAQPVYIDSQTGQLGVGRPFANGFNGGTAVGSGALANNSGTNNVAVGLNALGGANLTGGGNTATGAFALANDAQGGNNVASGYGALQTNSTGNSNSALGYFALNSNSTGGLNTASGAQALYSNTTGSYNTATGANALLSNTTGANNTASGKDALVNNTTGSYNTASGFQALFTGTTGSYSTAVGAFTLFANTTGGYDTGFGAYALSLNTTGTGNTAFGYAGLRSNTTGNNNIGFGYQSLYQNATGSNNIAMGYQAAYNVAGGSNNIEIGSAGAPADSNLIRIGTGQTAAFIAGIAGHNLTGAATVVVNSSGQLGVVSSSRRYKEDIAPMAAASERLYDLRPVTFRYKEADERGAKPLQYGLVAEEVAETFPELVVYNEQGEPETVQYQALAPILLNEVQQQRARIRAQDEQIENLGRQLARVSDLEAELASLKAIVAALPRADDRRVAMR